MYVCEADSAACACACVWACEAACVALVDCLPEARQVQRRRIGARVTRQVRQGSTSKHEGSGTAGRQTPLLSARQQQQQPIRIYEIKKIDYWTANDLIFSE